MTLPVSVEERARRLSDPAAKLRYLRVSVIRKRKPQRPWLAAACIPFALISLSPPAHPHLRPVPLPKPVATPLPEKIFLVEHSSVIDLYSNGLQIRTNYETNSNPRSFRAYQRATLALLGQRSTPAGIVFHTTESLLPPIEESGLQAINRTREGVLAYVRNGRYYNFVIDRFGQVFRIVPEDQTAFHAGHSIWADASSIFIDLNESFLGVAFEMRAGETPTPAQNHASRLLTNMLRAAYNIPDGNCVTHAQVSINPDNLRIGYHTDWGANFPFREAGLSVGYNAPVAAVELFGFNYDESFLNAVGNHPWNGLIAAERQILIDAGSRGFTAAHYRSLLQQHYRALRTHNHDRL